MVALLVVVRRQLLNPVVRDLLLLVVLRPWSHLHAHVAVERLDGQLRSQHRLAYREEQLRVDVRPLPLEVTVGLNLHVDDQIACRSANSCVSLL